MLYLILKISIISLLLIFLVHHLINFFKSTLTVPKIKDLVNNPTKKYENMYNIIKSQQGISTNYNYTNDTNDTNDTNGNYTNGNYTNENSNNFLNQEYTLIDLLPKKDEENMKTELKNFLKKQLTSPNNDISDINKITSSNQLDGTNISSLDSMDSNSISFSNY
jgi:hypothetical protein